MGVGHLDRQDVVLARYEDVGDAEPEARVSTPVLADMSAVDPDVGDLVGPCEMEEQHLPREVRGHRDVFAVPADPPVVVAAVRAVLGVPGVRHAGGAPRAVVGAGRFGAGASPLWNLQPELRSSRVRLAGGS